MVTRLAKVPMAIIPHHRVGRSIPQVIRIEVVEVFLRLQLLFRVVLCLVIIHPRLHLPEVEAAAARRRKRSYLKRAVAAVNSVIQ